MPSAVRFLLLHLIVRLYLQSAAGS